MKVYKYFNSDFKNKVTKGFYKVNTFANIRLMDQGKIGDSNEGKTVNHSGNIALRDPAHLQTMRNLGFGFGPNTQLEGCIVETEIDAHMFCVTTVRNDVYWQNLSGDQGGPYDSCVEISDFIEFAKRLLIAIGKEYNSTFGMKVDKCSFESNIGTIPERTTKFPSYFRKLDTEYYREQHELRAVIFPVEPRTLVPKIVRINAKDLIKIRS